MSSTKAKNLLPDMILYRNESHEDQMMCVISDLMFQLAEDRTSKENYSTMAFPVDDKEICYIIFDPLESTDPTIVFSTVVDENMKIVPNGSKDDSIRLYKRKEDAYNYVERICKLRKV